MSDRRAEIDKAELPPLDLVLGYGPILPMAIAAVLAWSPLGIWSLLVATLARLWGAVILAFVAGVRRGTSFYTPGGARLSELAASLGFFAVAFASLLLPERWADALLAVGYLGIAVVDWRAAKRGDVPRYFTTLRPPQMTLAAVALAAIAVRVGGWTG